MLFHSQEFLFVFLPVVFVGWLSLRRRNATAGMWWLLAASLVFYAWWNPWLLPLFVASIVVNYACGRLLAHRERPHRKPLLTAAVLLNLGALGYFKYVGFLLQAANDVFGTAFVPPHPVLPLGISFFTFLQIAWLVEAYQGRAGDETLLEYSLFVAFFPHLIAGPIIHHREVLPQLRSPERRRLDLDLAVGLTIFAVGMFKKVVLADAFARYANPVFATAEGTDPISVTEGWIGAFAFTLQTYFDFSGYSDMAIGLARLFGVWFPVNFNSPLKSTSMTELWRRWHMSLGRFLKDHCYLPLGGRHRHFAVRCFAAFMTMVACGVWHGAGWTYLLWGVAVGSLLVLEKCGRRLPARAGAIVSSPWATIPRVLWTTAAFVVSAALFRSVTVSGALRLGSALVGAQGETLFASRVFRGLGLRPERGLYWIVAGLVIVWGLPNTQQIMGRFRPAFEYRFRFPRDSWPGRLLSRLQWRPRWQWAAFLAVIFGLALSSMTKSQEFVYFQF